MAMKDLSYIHGYDYSPERLPTVGGDGSIPPICIKFIIVVIIATALVILDPNSPLNKKQSNDGNPTESIEPTPKHNPSIAEPILQKIN